MYLQKGLLQTRASKRNLWYFVSCRKILETLNFHLRTTKNGKNWLLKKALSRLLFLFLQFSPHQSSSSTNFQFISLRLVEDYFATFNWRSPPRTYPSCLSYSSESLKLSLNVSLTHFKKGSNFLLWIKRFELLNA